MCVCLSLALIINCLLLHLDTILANHHNALHATICRADSMHDIGSDGIEGIENGKKKNFVGWVAAACGGGGIHGRRLKAS